MKDIERINGFINLDNYFKDKYKLDEVNKYILAKNHIINIANSSWRYTIKFWFEFLGNNTLFKVTNNEECYIELISSNLIKLIELESAEYDLATFNNNKGVITKDFRKENHTYIFIKEILDNFYLSFKEINDNLVHNNLDDIWASLEFYFKNYENKKQIVANLMDKIIKLFVFDLIMLQNDRHDMNYAICINNITKEVMLAPIFDYSRSLINDNIYYNGNIKVNNYRYLKNYEYINTFIKQSSNEFQEKVYKILDTINPLNFKKVILYVEKTYKCEIPFEIKNNLITKFIKSREEIINNMSNKNSKIFKI